MKAVARKISGSLLVGLGLILLDTAVSSGAELVFEADQIGSEWRSPPGTFVLAHGEVRPAYIRGERDSVNAAANAERFVAERDRDGNPVRFGGIFVPDWVTVLPSNFEELPAAMDGDPSTAWAPSGDDPLSTWWLLIDLGRAVRATRVRLVFAEDGPPFEMFELYKSTGQQAFTQRSGVLDFRTIHRSTRPNLDHVLSYEVGEQPVRYLYFQAMEMTEGAKLAELEVFTLGDNIALGVQDRGGLARSVASREGGLAENIEVWEMVDGDYLTFFNLSTPAYNNWWQWESKGWFHLDLGNLFWVDLVRIVQQHELYSSRFHPLQSYVLYSSDASPAPPGSGGILGPFLSPLVGDFVWREVGTLSRNPPEGETRQRFLFEERLSPQPVRHLFLSHRNLFGGSGIGMIANIGEFQVYGRGFLPEVVLTSGFLDLGAERNITEISWDGNVPPGTRIQFRSRTGEEFRWEVTYWKKLGANIRNKEVTREEWEAFSATRKGAVDSTVVLEGWSPWSQPYLVPGETFVSPSPRKFAQLEVRLTTSDPDARASLQRVKLIHRDPVASALVGEIHPRRALPGVEEVFTYSIRPRITAGNQEFDDILILPPSPATLLDVLISGTSVGDAVEVLPAGGDSLWIRLPSAMDRQAASNDSDLAIEVVMATRVFRNGTLIESFAGASASPGSWQRVDPKDGRFENLTVLLPYSERILGDLSMVPSTLTPNGDEVNDATTITFTLFQIDQSSPGTVTIFDVSGRAIRTMRYQGDGGVNRIVWDGMDDSGETALPGTYICRVEIDTDSGTRTAVRSIAVAY